MADCVFCKIVAGQLPTDILYQDEHLVVFRDIYPKAPVHLLVVPKKHIINLMTIDETHQILMGHILTTLPKIAKAQGLTGFRTVINTGPEGGQVVFHLHLHLLGGGPLPKL